MVLVSDSEIVAICHCNSHEPLKHADGRTVSSSISYANTGCKCCSWSKIPSNSKRLVIGVYCPVLLALRWETADVDMFELHRDTLESILENSWRVLQPGGIVILDGGAHISTKIKNFAFVKQKHWRITFETLASVPTAFTSGPFVMFQKPSKTTKNKTKKNKTKRTKQREHNIRIVDSRV